MSQSTTKSKTMQFALATVTAPRKVRVRKGDSLTFENTSSAELKVTFPGDDSPLKDEGGVKQNSFTVTKGSPVTFTVNCRPGDSFVMKALHGENEPDSPIIIIES